MPIKIGIIDSGVRINHPAFYSEELNGYSLKVINDEVVKFDDFEDEIGHGTAIYYLINKNTDDAIITNIKIYFKECSVDCYEFEKIMKYISDYENFDIINISLGIVNYGSTKNLEDICNKMIIKGTKIISAFDNNGAVSFPAGLTNIIGVDASNNIDLSSKGFAYIENSIVNILGKNKNIKVAWLNPNYILVSGSSFLCAEFTSKVANNNKLDVSLLCEKIIKLEKRKTNTMNFKIINAAVFPFNKEIHSLARFHDLISFNIVDFYAPRISGNVNKNTSDILENCESNYIIKDIEKIEWDTFDTLIIGHIVDLSKLTKKDYSKILIEEAIRKGKKIYSFDDVLKNEIYDNYYTPKISEDMVPKKFGKIYKTNKPILSIIGTNSKQGKFTLQLELRRRFLNDGYNIGQIGTEPTSSLYGFDEIFHSGFNSEMNLMPYQICSLTNQMIWNITQKDVDIIITGCQSGMIAYNDYNISMIPFEHQIFLESIQPDLLIICINVFDEIKFVDRIIKYSEGLTGGKVVGLVCFPIKYSDDWKGFFGEKKRISETEENVIKLKFLKNLNKKVYMLDKEEEINDLYNECINYFSE